MAKLAPRFFDAAVLDREAFNRAEQRRWMATWEPVVARAYGVEHAPAPPSNDRPPLPPPRIQEAVERHLADWRMWMDLGRQAMERYRQRHPHALMSLCRMARLMDLGFEFAKLAVGLDSPNPLPEKITYDYNFTDFKRAYGQKAKPTAADSCSSGRESAPSKCCDTQGQHPSAAIVQGLGTHGSHPVESPPAWPPPETKRDITPVKLVYGPHGFLTFEYPKPDSVSS
jgi:hypothetical protein